MLPQGYPKVPLDDRNQGLAPICLLLKLFQWTCWGITGVTLPFHGQGKPVVPLQLHGPSFQAGG